MKLEDQVCSLENAKKLKELGVKQESLYFWTECCSKGWGLVCEDWHDRETYEFNDCHELKDHESYSAFTVGELLEIISIMPAHSEPVYMGFDAEKIMLSGPVNFITVRKSGFAHALSQFLILHLSELTTPLDATFMDFLRQASKSLPELSPLSAINLIQKAKDKPK